MICFSIFPGNWWNTYLHQDVLTTGFIVPYSSKSVTSTFPQWHQNSKWNRDQPNNFSTESKHPIKILSLEKGGRHKKRGTNHGCRHEIPSDKSFIYMCCPSMQFFIMRIRASKEWKGSIESNSDTHRDRVGDAIKIKN